MEQQWLFDLLIELVELIDKYTPIITELLNSYLFQSFYKIIIGYALLFWIVLIFWTTRDIIHRTHNILLQMIAILLVIVGNLFGLIIYLLLRPSQTLIAKYDEEIERKALFNNIETDNFCKKCHQKITDNFIFCPRCQHRLKIKCPGCGNLCELTHQFCNQCGKNLIVVPSSKTKELLKKKKNKLNWFKRENKNKNRIIKTGLKEDLKKEKERKK